MQAREDSTVGSCGLVEEKRFKEGVKTRTSGPLMCMAMTTGNPVMLEGNTFKRVLDWTSPGVKVRKTRVLVWALPQTYSGLTLQSFSAWVGSLTVVLIISHVSPAIPKLPHASPRQQSTPRDFSHFTLAQAESSRPQTWVS